MDPLAQRDGKLKRGKKKKMMKNNNLNNTANKKSKSAGIQCLDAAQYISSNAGNFALSAREELYNKSIEQLCELLKISLKEYLPETFSKEQLVEFLLTPKD